MLSTSEFSKQFIVKKDGFIFEKQVCVAQDFLNET